MTQGIRDFRKMAIRENSGAIRTNQKAIGLKRPPTTCHTSATLIFDEDGRRFPDDSWNFI